MINGLVRRPVAVLALFGALVIAIDHGCTPEPEFVRLVPNQAPETVVSGAPFDSSNAFHRYHVFWAGYDVDGTIAEYFVAVTDSNIAPNPSDYRRTLRTDSIIEFTANNEVVLSHAFWVFAVDNEGDRDPEPARVFFNAVDIHRPEPLIIEATKIVQGDAGVLAFQDTVPSSGTTVSFRWTATDADVGGRISAYRIKLTTDNQFTEIPAESTSVTYSDLPSGNYDFLVEAVDNAGAESLEPAVWRWVVNREPDTHIRQMFVSYRAAGEPGHFFQEITDFRTRVPTIRDSSRVLLFFEGNDNDGFTVDYAIRRIRCLVTTGSCRRLPFGSFFPDNPGMTEIDRWYVSRPQPVGTGDTTATYFTSNDYFLVIRSRDNELKADGTPDSVFFHVNFSPAVAADRIYPGPGALVPFSEDSLEVVFAADDVETPAVGLRYRAIVPPGDWFENGRFGPEFGEVADESELVQSWRPPPLGTHQIKYAVRDPGLRTDTLLVTFEVIGGNEGHSGAR